MKWKERLSIGLLLADRLQAKVNGREFLTVLTEASPSLMPELYGNNEPLKTRFLSVDECLASWRPPFLWKRKAARTTIEGAVWFANTDAHTGVYISVVASHYPMDEVHRFVESCWLHFDVHLAYVHLLTDGEMNGEQSRYERWYPIDIGVTTHDLRKGVPDLCWAMWFGRPYVAVIGKEKVLRAPAFLATEVSRDAVYVQVSPQIDDLRNDFAAFSARRVSIKEAVGNDIFLGNAVCRVPRFDIAER